MAVYLNNDYSRIGKSFMGAVCGFLLLSSGVARVRALEESPIAVPEPVETVTRVAGAIFSAGICVAVDTVETLWSPYDQFFYPLAELGLDAVVELSPDSFQTEIHAIASERMHERGVALQRMGKDFQEAAWDEQLRMISYVILSAKAPSILVNAFRPINNLHLFGTYTSPPLFHAVWKSQTIKIDKYFQNTIRETEGAERLIYVITKEGKLLVTNYYLSKHVNRGSGTTTRHIHRDLSKEPVVSAGEVLVKDKKITLIDNQSGHFRAWSTLSEELSEITEYVFRRYGYSEVKGIFQDHTHKFAYMPDIPPIATRPKKFESSLLLESGNLAALFENTLKITPDEVELDLQFFKEHDAKIQAWVAASTEAMGSNPNGASWQNVANLEKEILDHYEKKGASFNVPIEEYKDIFTTQANRGEIFWYLTTRQEVEYNLQLLFDDTANFQTHAEKALSHLTPIANQLEQTHIKWYGGPDPFFSAALQKLNKMRPQFHILGHTIRLHQMMSQYGLKDQSYKFEPRNVKPPSPLVQNIYHKWEEKKPLSKSNDWDRGVAAVRHQLDTHAKAQYSPKKPEIIVHEAICIYPPYTREELLQRPWIKNYEDLQRQMK